MADAGEGVVLEDEGDGGGAGCGAGPGVSARGSPVGGDERRGEAHPCRPRNRRWRDGRPVARRRSAPRSGSPGCPWTGCWKNRPSGKGCLRRRSGGRRPGRSWRAGCCTRRSHCGRICWICWTEPRGHWNPTWRGPPGRSRVYCRGCAGPSRTTAPAGRSPPWTRRGLVPGRTATRGFPQVLPGFRAGARSFRAGGNARSRGAGQG